MGRGPGLLSVGVQSEESRLEMERRVRSRRRKLGHELRIFGRVGLVRYLRGRRSLRRFHASVAKLP